MSLLSSTFCESGSFPQAEPVEENSGPVKRHFTLTQFYTLHTITNTVLLTYAAGRSVTFSLLVAASDRCQRVLSPLCSLMLSLFVRGLSWSPLVVGGSVQFLGPVWLGLILLRGSVSRQSQLCADPCY